jgi:hypothetical protein
MGTFQQIYRSKGLLVAESSLNSSYGITFMIPFPYLSEPNKVDVEIKSRNTRSVVLLMLSNAPFPISKVQTFYLSGLAET